MQMTSDSQIDYYYCCVVHGHIENRKHYINHTLSSGQSHEAHNHKILKVIIVHQSESWYTSMV